MPTLILTSSQVTEQRAGRASHRELESTQQVIAVTDINDATTKLQNALTPLVGSGTASTHATAFNARQSAALNPSKHVMSLGGNTGMTAVYKP